MGKKKSKVTPFRKERKITYNKYKPNRAARRLGIKPEEQPEQEEPKKVSKAAVLRESVQRAREAEKKIVPPGMTYGEYMAYLKEKQQQLEEKRQEAANGKA